MTVRWLGSGDALGTSRGGTVVCLAVDPADREQTAPALAALERHTPREVPVIAVGVIDETELGSPAQAERLAIRATAGAPIAPLLALGERLAAPADVVIISARCRVPDGWLERLRAAARSDTTVATATPLSDGGGGASIPAGSSRDPDGAVASRSPRRRPRILIGGPSCLYGRRDALELVGGLPVRPPGGPPPEPPSGDELQDLTAALSLACLETGLINVVADDLYVGCRPAGPAGSSDDAGIGARLRVHDRDDERSALSRARSLARVRTSALRVTIDARSLGPAVGGCSCTPSSSSTRSRAAATWRCARWWRRISGTRRSKRSRPSTCRW